MSSDGSGSGKSKVNWATPVVTLIEALKRGPYAAMLGIGLLLLLASFIQQLGSFKMATTPGSQGTMRIFGAVLVAVALIAPLVGAQRRSREREGSTPYPLPPEANDLDFMFKLFYNGMPPAFVKRVHEYDESTKAIRANDILYSKAFDRFQAAPELAEVTQGDDESSVVHHDHSAGDLRAVEVEGRWSMQFELPPSFRVPILTVKTSFVHRGRLYVAGWYVPVDRQAVVGGGEELQVRDVNGLPKLKPIKETRGDDGITVYVGEALRQPLKPGFEAKPPQTPPQPE